MGAAGSSGKGDALRSSFNSRQITEDEQLQYTLSNNSFDPSRVTCEKSEEVEGALILRNVLSPEECTSLLKYMFPDKKNPGKNHTAHPILFRDWEPDPKAAYKKIGVRIFTKSEQVSSALYERVKDVIPQSYVTYSKIEKRKEVWRASGLHSRVRFVCYGKGQNFPPHRDDPYIKSDLERSHFTFVIYLSNSGPTKKDDFTGGEFAFLEAQKGSLDTTDRLLVVPEPGLVVVFPHQLLHESKPLTRGLKFMIRSDIMYTFDAEQSDPREKKT